MEVFISVVMKLANPTLTKRLKRDTNMYELFINFKLSILIALKASMWAEVGRGHNNCTE